MHNINKPFAIIIIIYNMAFKIVLRYIFIWWKLWLHLNLEIYEVHGPVAAAATAADAQHELLYHFWYDVTPFRFLKLFIFIFIVVFIYRLLTDSYKLSRFVALLEKYRPIKRRYEFLQWKRRFYIKHLRYWYVIYTAYRYNFFDNIARLSHYVISLIYKIKLKLIKVKIFFKCKKK